MPLVGQVYGTERATLIQGDCLEVMQSLPDASVDAVITDPPYGINFLGKEWDHGVPGIPFWEACVRVARPGAFLLAFGGSRTFHRLTCALEDAGWQIRDTICWLYGQGMPKSKSCLKPAWEPIILAMKPANRIAMLNIDACRLPTGESTRRTNKSPKGWSGGWSNDIAGSYETGTDAGRWPANVVLDEEAGQLLDEQTGRLHALGTNRNGRSSLFGLGHGEILQKPGYTDAGGASRFFYCSKASKRERGEDNHHPCVKPLDLLRWLCILTATPEGGTVLDPFVGSGTTGLACLETGRKFIGIEIEPAYCTIAKQRIAKAELACTKQKET